MDEGDARQVAEKLWRALQAGDWETAGSCLHDDFVQEWPQSGERIIGRDNALAIEQNFPDGLPTMRFRRTLAAGDLAVLEVELTYADGSRYLGTSILELRDGKVLRETDYYSPAVPGTGMAGPVGRADVTTARGSSREVGVEHSAGTERLPETARTGPWLHVYEDLSGRDPVGLAAVELEVLAEAAWWLCKTDESIVARQRAYAAFRDAYDDRGAARTAARLFHEHFYRGEGAVAVGWLRRGFRHLERDPGCVEGGWLQMAEAELHLHQGPLEQAVDGAAHAVQTARDHGDADLAAVAMQIQGRALIAQGRIDEGLGLLDEAMTCVLAGELAPLYTGWVYCSVILACKDLADLQRASEWTEAARVWCETLPATTPYSQGLCRIYRGEVLALRGAWDEAEGELRRAHQQLLAHKPQGAAEASYGVGEVLRRRGDLAGAEQAFVRAQQLGWDPQPGMALLRLAQGRVEAAAAALRSALASPTVDRFGRARLLAAQVEVGIAAGALDQASDAARELMTIADGLSSAAVRATASMAQGALQLAAGRPAVALEQLRGALNGWRKLQLPFEEATARLLIGTTQRMLGDEEGGRIEIDAARAGFERLGAAADARRTATLLQRGRASPRVLTDREVQVLQLVAAGMHNRDIAGALHLSEHTVARHMQNILAKLGVSSRAAATSAAIQQGLLRSDG